MNAPLDEIQISELLAAWNDGKDEAWNDLVPAVYEELRAQARRLLRRERSDHTLQTTALVHETYMKFADQRVLKWKNRAHFFVAASEIMRYLLVDHARKRNREKRGGDLNIQRLDSDLQIASKSLPVDLIALDEALKRLEGWDRQQAKIVELRYFGGCSISETAEILAISIATVNRDWSSAKAWLHQELSTDR